MGNIKLILGSSSRFRNMLMIQAGYDFSVVEPDIDEKSIRSTDPAELVTNIALAKCDAVTQKTTGQGARIIITSDQVKVRVRDGAILEKPLTSSAACVDQPDRDLAREYLVGYNNSPIRTHTSLVVYHSQLGRRVIIHDIVELIISPFAAHEIEQILDDPITYEASGGLPYGVSTSRACEIIKNHQLRLIGDPSSFTGLPLQRLRSALSAFGYVKHNAAVSA